MLSCDVEVTLSAGLRLCVSVVHGAFVIVSGVLEFASFVLHMRISSQIMAHILSSRVHVHS